METAAVGVCDSVTDPSGGGGTWRMAVSLHGPTGRWGGAVEQGWLGIQLWGQSDLPAQLCYGIRTEGTQRYWPRADTFLAFAFLW